MTGNPYKKGIVIPSDPLDGDGAVAGKGSSLPEATPAEGWDPRAETLCTRSFNQPG